MLIEQLRSRAAESSLAVLRHPIDADQFGVRWEPAGGRLGREQLIEILTLKREVAGVVKVAEAPGRQVEIVQCDRRLGVRLAVVGRRRRVSC